MEDKEEGMNIEKIEIKKIGFFKNSYFWSDSPSSEEE